MPPAAPLAPNDAVASNISSDPNPPPVPEPPRPLYRESSQFKHWRFSPKQLEARRATVNERAIARVRAGWEEEKRDDPESDPRPPPDLSPPTPAEELALLTFYMSSLPGMCKAIGFPEVVEATTATYLKRFYLTNSVIEWHPKNVMYTVLFLASKTCNIPISITDFCNRIKNTNKPDSILELEFLVSQSLRFEFAVHHAHRAAWGIYLDMQAMPDPPAIPTLESTFAAVQKAVRLSRLTSAELLFSPAQIALACWRSADSALTDRYAAWKRDAFGAPQVPEGVLDRIAGMLEEAKRGVDREVVRLVDRRLRLWRDPSKIEGSALYKKRQAEAEAADAEKRAKRARDAQVARESHEAVFGLELISQGDPLPGAATVKEGEGGDDPFV